MTLTVDRTETALLLPVLDGPSPVAERPALRPAARAQADPSARSKDGWWRWRIEEDVVGCERRAVAGYGGDHPAEGDVPSFLDRYGGAVGVSIDDPGRAWAEGEGAFEIRYPEATVNSAATVRIDSDRDTYHVRIELVVGEVGQEPWRRRWDRTIPRDLQ